MMDGSHDRRRPTIAPTRSMERVARGDGYLTYGTHVPATGTLLWFLPTARVAPTPVREQASGRGVIDVEDGQLTPYRKGNEWAVTGR